MSDSAPSSPESTAEAVAPPWPNRLHATLKSLDIHQVAYVPDAGHARLIDLCHADPSMRTLALTTEEEGIALMTGAWLGGDRGVLLMQSSGVGNCINMLSLARSCRTPLAMLVTMRGEWGEFNPWQLPMGGTTPQALELAGVTTYRVDREEDLIETVGTAVGSAFDTQSAVAVLLSQRFLGRKQWVK